MYTSIKRILSVLFVFMLLLPMAAIAEDASEEAEAVYVLDYFSDTALDLTQYKGKAVYMNFFTNGAPIVWMRCRISGRFTIRMILIHWRSSSCIRGTAKTQATRRPWSRPTDWRAMTTL